MKKNIKKLKKELGNIIRCEKEDRTAHSWSWGDFKKYVPNAVCRPKNVLELRKIVRAAYKHKVNLVPYGGGTDMGGGSTSDFGLVVDTRSLNKVLETDLENKVVSVEAGISVQALNDHLKKYGYYFAQDPESKPVSTIGGGLANNGDSTRGILAGGYHNQVLSLDAVLAKPGAPTTSFGSRKAHSQAAGYSFHHCFIGSEGTLGIVTKATLKIRKIPEVFSSVEGMVMFAFEEKGDGAGMQKATNTIDDLITRGLMLESAHVNCPDRFKYYTQEYRIKHGKNPDITTKNPCILAITFSGDKEVVESNKNHCKKKVCAEIVKEKEIMKAWWTSKYDIKKFSPFRQKWARSQENNLRFITADVSVPPGRVGKLYKKFASTTKELQRTRIGMAIYNKMPNTASPSTSCAIKTNIFDEEDVRLSKEYVNRMSKFVITECEGSMTSFIGVGRRLKHLNVLEHGREKLDLMKEFKKMLDPKGIMNAGKKI